MSLVVVGIAQDPQTVRKLEQGLETAGLPLDSIEVIAPDEIEEAPAFFRADDTLMLSDAATQVPGLSASPSTESSVSDSLSERLADFEIPDSEMDRYARALRSGQRIVAYFARPETLTTAQELFRGAMVADVRVY